MGRHIKKEGRLRPVYGIGSPQNKPLSVDDPRILPLREHRTEHEEAEEERCGQKVVTVFTFVSFCGLPGVPPTHLEQNQDLQKELADGWIIEAIDAVASDTRELNGNLCQIATTFITLSKAYVGAKEKST